jgi:hypothetical protein
MLVATALIIQPRSERAVPEIKKPTTPKVSKEIRQTSNEEFSQRKSQDIDKPYPDKVWVWTNVGIYDFQKRGCKSKGSRTLEIHLQFWVLCILAPCYLWPSPKDLRRSKFPRRADCGNILLVGPDYRYQMLPHQ